MPKHFLGKVERRGADTVVSGLFDDSRVTATPSRDVGSIVEVAGSRQSLLAPPGSALARVYLLLARHRLNPIHAEAVVAETRAIEASPGFDDNVEDWTDAPFVTIDNEESHDLDQALYIEREGTGYVVCYALADASYYVRPGSTLFSASVARGSSYYVPGLVVPMLPKALSEGIVSLNPGVERRAVVFVIKLSRAGEVTDTAVRRVRMRSQAKLTYDGVQRFFDGEAASPLADQPYTESLELLREVGERRLARALSKGTIEYNRREIEVDIGADPDRFELNVRERNDVERFNEQISLLCNTQGALILETLGHDTTTLQAIYRVHLPPLEQRLAQLRETLASMAHAHGLGTEWVWSGEPADLAVFVRTLPKHPATARIRAAAIRQVRYSNRSSQFSDKGGRHHALDVDRYARFTAPMREIVGIFTHKELFEALEMTPAGDADEDRALRTQIIDAGNSARSLQRSLDKEITLMAIDQLLRDELELPCEERPPHVGTVIGLHPTRLYVALDAFPLDIKVYTHDLETRMECQYSLVGAEMVPAQRDTAPTFRIGDAIAITVASYDQQRRRFHFDATPV